MRREFEERMDKMKGEVQKIQEEKVCLYVVCECACACACTCMYYLSHVRSLALSYHTNTRHTYTDKQVHLMGLEQRLRQEFQTQVQAEQMSNEELRIRLETLQAHILKSPLQLPDIDSKVVVVVVVERAEFIDF